jgi:hypothetical protein
MKKVLFLMSAMLVLTLTSCSQSIKTLDEKYGFRNAKFEMPITSFKNLKEYSIEPTSYIITTDDLKLDGYDLEYIEYGFTDDYERLSNIIIQPLSSVDCAGVLKYFQKIYGAGQKLEVAGIEGENWNWIGEKVVLSYMKDGDDVGLFIIECIKYLSDEEKDILIELKNN